MQTTKSEAARAQEILPPETEAPAPAGTAALMPRAASLDVLNLLDPLEISENAQKVLEKAGVYRDTLLQIVLRQTSISQWVNFRGEGADAKDSFYPMGSASAAMLAFFGIHWSTPGPGPGMDGGSANDELFQAVIYTDAEGERWWIVKSRCWREGKFIAHAEGKKKIGGFARNELDARQGAFENLLSRAARHIFGLGSKGREDFKKLGLDLEKCRVATFQDRKSASSEDPDEAVIKWGNAKGKKVSELTDDDLVFYQKRQKADVADPAKAKFKPERLLKALDAEIERRAAKPAASAEDAEKLEKTIQLIREEAAAAGISESANKKLEAAIAAGLSQSQADVWLETYKSKRKEAGK